MAFTSTVTTGSAPEGPAAAQGQGDRGRSRGGRGGRGGRDGRDGNREARSRGRGGGGGRGATGGREQGRSRGDGAHPRHQQSAPSAPTQPTPFKPPSNDHDSGGGSGERPTGAAASSKGAAGEQPAVHPAAAAAADAAGHDGDDGDAEVCFICASDIVHQSVAPCNHRTCHICSLRMRALYKSRLCPHCRTEAKLVIFTNSKAEEKRYEDFSDADFAHTDDVLGIRYETRDIQDDTMLLLRYNCPDGECEVACFGWPDLHRHVKTVHHKVMCDLCTRNKKVFTHEHELYTKEELRKHEKFGDQRPGEADTTGFKGHPECGFCRQRFYGDDELYVHCREKHEKCHLCERANPQRQHQYYVNYDALEQHFKKDHFLCPDTECLEKKFMVFASEMDLKAHQLEAHPNGLSKDARRDARRVDMSSFDYRQPHDDRSERRRGGREGRGVRGGGRGRDPNTDPLPTSSAQPLRRDEIAYQRQMAIQSAQSVTTRTFGGQLTAGPAYTASVGNQSDMPATVNVPRTASAPTEYPQMQNLSLNGDLSSRPSTNTAAVLTPQDQARQIQHSAVIARASQMLGNDGAKISRFTSCVSTYRTGSLNATQMVDSLLAIFDVPAAELGKLIKELADLYDNETRRANLLKAWNDWRAINEDYPSLPGPSGQLPGSGSSTSLTGGRRILKLKSSTAQSQRAPQVQSRNWGTIAHAGVGAGSSMAQPVNRAVAGRVGATPWAAPAAAVNRSGTSTPQTTAAPVARQALPSSVAFPSLPAASKPKTTMAGRFRGAARWDDRAATSANAWGGGSSSAGPSSSNVSGTVTPAGDTSDVVEDGTVGKKKGRKGKQQTLYHFG